MKKSHLLSVLLVFPLGAACGQTNALTPEEEKRAALRMPDLDRSALEPGRRKPTDVKPGERNPFGAPAVQQPEEEEEVKIEVETEEMKLRRIIQNMRVTGLSGQPGAYRALLGPLHISKGEPLPPLFPDQTEKLWIEDITDTRVVIRFVERRQQQDLPPRSPLEVAVDLAPRVDELMLGQFFTSLVKFDEKGALNVDPLKIKAIDDISEQVKTNQGTQALIEHPRALMGDTSNRKRNDSPPPIAEE